MLFSVWSNFKDYYYTLGYSSKIKIFNDVCEYIVWFHSENPFLFFCPLFIFLFQTIFWSMYPGSVSSVTYINRKHEFTVKNPTKNNLTLLWDVFSFKNKLKFLYCLNYNLYL